MPRSPKPFEQHQSGAFLHGTKADLSVGDLLVPGRNSNYDEGRVMNHVYVTKTLDAAVWGAEFAKGDGRCRIYVVEPEVQSRTTRTSPTRSFRATRRCPTARGNPYGSSGNSPTGSDTPTRSSTPCATVWPNCGVVGST